MNRLRTTGIVDFFGDKGFGFIIPEGGGGRIFVHWSDIDMEGFRKLNEGETVEFRIVSGEGGRLRAVDVRVTAPSKLVAKITGIVKWFDADKGHGFITPTQAGEDVFVHYSAIQGREHHRRKILQEGEEVSFVVCQTGKGPRAGDVVSLGRIHRVEGSSRRYKPRPTTGKQGHKGRKKNGVFGERGGLVR